MGGQPARNLVVKLDMPQGFKYTHLFKMMNIAFIEIRASNSLTKNYAICNLFHNVPMMMKNERAIEEIWEELSIQATRTKITAFLQEQANYAVKNLSRE